MASKTYLYQPDKKLLSQGAVLTDESGAAIYEARMTKRALLGPMQFEFVNHLTHQTTPHKVGHTVTTETSTNGVTDLFSTKSRFKLDGKNIWDLLHEEGIRINSRMSSGKLGMTYDVTLKGQPLATLATATPGGKSILTSAHCYQVTADEESLDLAFLVTFAIARTEQVFYS